MSKEMVHHFDHEHQFYIGSTPIDRDPLNPERILIPHGATLIPPPKEEEGFVRAFIEGEWVQLEKIEVQEKFKEVLESETNDVLGEISDRQFFQELAVRNLITETEAEDAVASGIIPASLLLLVDQLPEEQQFPARMFLKGAITFDRFHPMVEAIGSLYDLDAEGIDDIWKSAINL